METLMPGNGTSQTYTPQLKTVLKTYQLTAVKSLQGPSSAFLGMECKNNLHDTTNYNTTRTQLIDKDNNIKKLIDDNNFDSKKIILKKTIDDSDDDTIICNNNKLINEKLINNKLLNYDKQRVLEFTIPILTTSDQNCSERCETILENERISCFVVGGERRLCLPQILNTVLQDFSLHQINQVCDELQIYCSRCTHDQLEELKLSGILPRNAPSCGLITQTDAERLVSSLLLRNDNVNELLLINNKKIHSNNKIICSKNNKLIDDNNQDADNDDNNIIEKFKVYHECFGKCKGLFDPDLFDSEDSSCIECLECGCQFSPQKFVRHVHRSLENRTCHWGFDSTNWRSYLLLSRDQPHYTKVVTLFTNLKERCPVARYKRKATTELKQEDKLVKRPKKDDCFGVYPGNGVATYLASPAGVNDPYFKHLAVLELASRTASAFRPWNAAGSFKHRDSTPMVPAYLSRGPPVLQHPERVVPLSECERFEPHYQPNVALAPIIVPGINSVAATTAAVPLQRRPHQERHRLNNETQSLTSRLPPPPPTLPLSQSLKLDEHQEVTVKIERPSSPCSDLINDYSVRSCSPVDQQEDVERQKIIKITQISSNDSNNNDSNNISNDNDEDEGNDNDDDDSGNDGGNNGGEDEEESSAAVTSSTVTVEPSIIKIGISSSPESSSSSTLVNDSDTETNSNAIIELEERLIALDVPQDVIGLVRKVADELNNLKIRRCKDANEILKLRDEISRKKINYDKMFNDNNEKIKVENSSAADSTEDNEAVDEKIIITTPLDNNHEPETPITISRD